MAVATSVNPGTWARVKPMSGHRATEGSSEVEYRYQNLAALAEYRNFSPEEHRLQDYEKLEIVSDAGPSSQQFSKMTSSQLLKSGRLAFLRGKGIEVHVGRQTPSDENIWNLPVNLISRHSEYFKAACLWNMTGKISLPEYDPIVFGLFVEWAYYSTYDTFMFESHPSIHTKCWVMADYLLCNDLKNYAMGRLFKQHMDVPASLDSPVRSEDVQYVCSYTSPHSRLRQFYVDFVVDRFGDPNTLRGDTADWDGILQNDPQTRSKVLDKMRNPSNIHLKGLKEYLEVKEVKMDSHLRLDIGLAGLSIGEKENKTAESKGNSDISQIMDDYQFSFKAARLKPIISQKVNLDLEQVHVVDEKENVYGTKSPETKDVGGSSPGRSLASNRLE
ncbi:hypothetical protein ACHAPU_006368 [Fusarium lateritium]